MSKEEEKKDGPSLGELIETRRFLGREFLAWLWFESETFEERFSIESSRTRVPPSADPRNFGECELHLEKSITLETGPDFDQSQQKEKSTLSGFAPSGTPEAKEALRQGKLPTKAKIVVRREEQEFAFALDADALALSAVKIPALIKGEGEDPFYERIQLIEEIEGAVEALFGTFLRLRLDEPWESEVLPAMREWMREEEGRATERYRRTRGRVGVRLTELSNEPERAPRHSTTQPRVVQKRVKEA